MSDMRKSPVSNNHNYVLFEKKAKTYFRFLIDDYHFRLSKVEQTGFVKIIRFESKGIFVNLYYGPPAYEVEIGFGRIGIDDAPDGHSFALGDLVLLDTCSGWKESFQDEDRLTGQIMFCSHVIRKCGSACLRGEQAVFEKMNAQRDAALLKWQQEVRMTQMRRELDTAWKQKNYGRVIMLLSASEEMLTKAERKKLEYAKKQTPKWKQSKMKYIIILLGLALIVAFSIYAYRQGEENAVREKTKQTNQNAK